MYNIFLYYCKIVYVYIELLYSSWNINVIVVFINEIDENQNLIQKRIKFKAIY